MVDEGDHHFWRSSSAFAKYADANRRISLAFLSSRFSFSSAFSLARSSVVKPSRFPVSRSACRTHRRNVSAVQPIFVAIETMTGQVGSLSLTLLEDQPNRPFLELR